MAHLESVRVDCGHPSFLSNGHGRLFPGLKRAEREAAYSPPYTAEVKSLWSYASAPQYFFMSRYLTKRRDGFIYLQVLTSLVDHVLVFGVMTPYELVGVSTFWTNLLHPSSGRKGVCWACAKVVCI